MGLPIRLGLSEGNEDQIEWKTRTSEKSELIDQAELLKRLTQKLQ